MNSPYQSPLHPKRGARAQRVSPPEPRKTQPVINRQWQEQRRRARSRSIFANTVEVLVARLLGRVKSDG